MEETDRIDAWVDSLAGRSNFDDLPDDRRRIGSTLHAGTNGAPAKKTAAWTPPLFTAAELLTEFPTLDEPVIDGLLRYGETMNLISVSKIGKSWLLLNLLLCIVTGKKWLGRFNCRQGPVLLIDNELKPPVLAKRIRTVAEKMGIAPEQHNLHVWPVRGVNPDFGAIGRFLRKQSTAYSLIAVDAKYRTLPPGKSENDNAFETELYNEIDRWAHAKILVHHSSKGGQGEKRVTDVGSGAGAQSRAADCHLILREHAEEDAVVLEAAVRSFAPVEPLPLRWQWPLWHPDDGLDSRLLRGASRNETQSANDAESDTKVLDACLTWRTKLEIKSATGFGLERITRAILRLRERGLLDAGEEDRPRHPKSEVFRRSIRAPHHNRQTDTAGNGGSAGGVSEDATTTTATALKGRAVSVMVDRGTGTDTESGVSVGGEEDTPEW